MGPRGDFALPPPRDSGNIWSYLGLSQLVSTGDATGIWWVAPKGAAKHPKVHRTAPQQRALWSQMSVVLQLRSCHPNRSLQSGKDVSVRLCETDPPPASTCVSRAAGGAPKPVGTVLPTRRPVD